MQRKTRQFAVGILVLAGFAAVTNRLSAQEQKPSFTVHVRNRAGVNSETLQEAEHAATKTFRKAGVAVRWVSAVPTGFTAQEETGEHQFHGLADIRVEILSKDMAETFPQVRTAAADDPLVGDLFVPDANVAPVQNALSGSDGLPDRLFNEATELLAKGRYVEAAAAYRKACPALANACTNLGFMYSHAKGVELSYATAADLYRLGCDHGNPLGCTNLGIMYWTNELPKNNKQATQLFERACREGDGAGCRDLGYLYEYGYGGLERNRDRAEELYGLADKLSRVHHIPFHLQDGMVLIDLNIDGQIEPLIVDTGANRTIVNPKILAPSNAPRVQNQTILTPVGDRQAYPVTFGWNLDGRKVSVAALACDLDYPDGAMGLFGADLLETFKSVRFDYFNMYIVLEEK